MTARSWAQLLTITIAIMVASYLLPVATKDAQALRTERTVPGQIIVELLPGVQIDTIDSLFGTQVLEPFLDSTNTNTFLLQAPADVGVQTTLDLIKASGLVSYAEPNYVTGAPEADDGTSASARHRAFPAGDATPTTSNYSKSPYSGSDLHLALARRISKGERTTVAVLDTGVQLNHPELQDRFVGVPRYDFVDDDNDPSEPPLASTKAQRRQEAVGHGTHVAGIVHLVAPKAKLMPLRVLDREGYGDNFHVAEAVAFAYMHGADVINLSLGTPSWSRLLKKQVDNAIGHGVVVTAAAGNYDSAMPQYPATKRLLIWKASDHDGLLAVTSVDPEGNKSSFANYGKWVDIAAPGEEILSTYPVSRHAYWSGTSMATPFVAGEAALIQAKRRQAFGDSLNPAKVEGRIRSSAQCHQQVNATYNHMLGSGRIDIGNGVKNVQGRPCSLLP